MKTYCVIIDTSFKILTTYRFCIFFFNLAFTFIQIGCIAEIV